MKLWILRLGVLFLMIPLVFFASSQLAHAQVSVGVQTPEDGDEPDCRECHWHIFLDWEASKHGQGLSCGQCHLSDQNNHSRSGHGAQGGPERCMSCHTTGYNAENDTWEEDNIHCKACHSPIELNHPDEPMPTNRSGVLCGGCHIQAHLEWQLSKHSSEGVTCVDCHNQHTTSLRFVYIDFQCGKCHQSRFEEFAHSRHEAEKVNCADCHLSPIEGPVQSGSARLDHSFMVELSTCNSCHLKTLHNSGGELIEENSAQETSLDAMSTNARATVTSQPNKPNQLSFVAFFGALMVGLVIIRPPRLLRKIPWRRRNKESRDE